MNPITTDNYEIWIVDYFDGKLTALQKKQLQAFIDAHPELNIDLEEENWLRLENEEVGLTDKQNLKKDERTIQSRFDELCIKKIENLTNENEEAELAEMLLQNAKHAEEWLIWLKTKLSIDVDIIYRWKSELIKQMDETTTTDWEMFEELESGRQDTIKIQAWERNPLLKTHWKAFTLSKIETDRGIVFPDKNQLKQSNGKVIPLYLIRSLSVAAVLALLVGIWLALQPGKNSPVNTFAYNKSGIQNETKTSSSVDTNYTKTVVEKEKSIKTPKQIKERQEPQTQQNELNMAKPTPLLTNVIEMPYKTINQIAMSNQLPVLDSPAPVSYVDWSGAMAFETKSEKNKSLLKKAWAFAGLPSPKGMNTNGFNISIDKKELTETADLAIRKLSIGTLRLNQENGKNSIALNKELLKRQ
jgi:hypothetical protein